MGSQHSSRWTNAALCAMVRGRMRQVQSYSRLLLVAAVAVAAAAVACTGSSNAPEVGAPPAADTAEQEPEGTGSAVRPDAAAESGTSPGPNANAFCELTKSYFVDCGNASELSCGAAGFDAWCSKNDKLNSDAFREAEEHCLTTKNCDGTARRTCDYDRYNSAKQTASQKALVKAYCQTCEPLGVADCEQRSIHFDKSGGLDAVPDIFIAAWELSDDVVDTIRKSCTGPALQPGSVKSCADAFASCAGDIYLDRVPDCSK